MAFGPHGYTRNLAADAVWLIHGIVTMYIFVGWVLPPPLLYLYIVALPLVLLQWRVLGYCVLTRWEQLLRGGGDVDTRFVGDALARRGLVVGDRCLDASEYVVIIVLWLTACAQLIIKN